MVNFWLKRITILILELAVVAGAVWYIYEKEAMTKVDVSEIFPTIQQGIKEKIERKEFSEFPEASQPIQKNFDWTYKNQKYSLSLVLHQSIYDYYKIQPKKYSYSGVLPLTWEEDYYGMFLKSNEKDSAIIDLAKNLQDLGRSHKLSDDQVVEMVMAFVQTIDYDDAKAKNILAKVGDETMQYPYETLFVQKGVCSDKSFLATVILRTMGFGTTLFVYDQENHMAIGIQCPKSYSNYESGYCFGESTAIGNKIGIIPDLNPESNKTVEIRKIDATDAEQVGLKRLSQVKIFQSTLGKEYVGIIATKKTEAEIISLKKSLSSLLATIESQKNAILKKGKELDSLRKDLDSHQDDDTFEKYNALAKKYNKLLDSYKNEIEKYNQNITLYNKTVERYNTLIQQ